MPRVFDMMDWRTRAVVRVLFVIAEVLSPDAELSAQVRILANHVNTHDFKP